LPGLSQGNDEQAAQWEFDLSSPERQIAQYVELIRQALSRLHANGLSISGTSFLAEAPFQTDNGDGPCFLLARRSVGLG
jgi:hypothetical protein